jgi:hypothetical protein
MAALHSAAALHGRHPVTFARNEEGHRCFFSSTASSTALLSLINHHEIWGVNDRQLGKQSRRIHDMNLGSTYLTTWLQFVCFRVTSEASGISWQLRTTAMQQCTYRAGSMFAIARPYDVSPPTTTGHAGKLAKIFKFNYFIIEQYLSNKTKIL